MLIAIVVIWLVIMVGASIMAAYCFWRVSRLLREEDK